MDEKKLSEILRYSRSNELLVVDLDNRLIVVKCPFKVVALNNVGKIFENHTYHVTKVKVTPKLITVFEVQNTFYYYYYFEIQL